MLGCGRKKWRTKGGTHRDMGRTREMLDRNPELMIAPDILELWSSRLCSSYTHPPLNVYALTVIPRGWLLGELEQADIDEYGYGLQLV